MLAPLLIMQPINTRNESDALGTLAIPADALYGIHAARAARNFSLSGESIAEPLICALAEVKLACALTNHTLGYLPATIADAIATACTEIIRGEHRSHIITDALQGGAGTSANMNLNEVIANRAGQLLGHTPGSYHIHPLQHVNLHQSTNDVFPTALHVAALHQLTALEQEITSLQDLLQRKEQIFRDVMKVARTQLQDALPMTFGMTFGAWAEAISRDRWRIFKSRERLRQVNLGGTAIGTGLGAPREYILRVTETLRTVTGLRLTRAENLVDATQNTDRIAEVSGILKAFATNLFKISSDIRLLSSGPHCGLAELRIPAVQAGSSIMPGKINPVIAEGVSQAALRVMHNDGLIGSAVSLGSLELNQFMPLIAHTLLSSLSLLHNATIMLRDLCLADAEPDEAQCSRHLASSRSLATLLVPYIGYARTEMLLARAESTSRPFALVAAETLGVDHAALDALLSPRRMQQLGFTPDTYADLTVPDTGDMQ